MTIPEEKNQANVDLFYEAHGFSKEAANVAEEKRKWREREKLIDVWIDQGVDSSEIANRLHSWPLKAIGQSAYIV